MDEERTHKEIELRSEEVQEVMGRIPPAILRYGIVVLLGIIAVVLAGSACFSYPDTVETEFTLTTPHRAGGYALFPPDSGAGKCAGGVFVLPAGLEQLPSAHAGKQDV